MKWMELAQARETFAELQQEVRRMDVWICRLTGGLEAGGAAEAAAAAPRGGAERCGADGHYSLT
jgi:hypothetical protein